MIGVITLVIFGIVVGIAVLFGLSGIIFDTANSEAGGIDTFSLFIYFITPVGIVLAIIAWAYANYKDIRNNWGL